MSFRGFPDAALIFFEGLEADNSRPYWTAHRETYDHDVRAPMQALLDELAPEFGAGRIYRPYRDVRFSKNKTPYKTAVAASAGSFYVQLGADGLLVGGGYYHLERDQLARLRRAVDDDVTGRGLQRLVAAVAQAGLDVGGDMLVTRPRGCPADHPRLDLMRHRSLTAGRRWTPEPWLHTPAAGERVRDAWRAVQPLCEWLDTNVGADGGGR
ncbi:MAG: DUF2461 domain-containing protein [Geodermatophilaceae bacterium]|nr:DUF2461 domain-containing protein [Geodermatophilaceae bacterium]